MIPQLKSCVAAGSDLPKSRTRLAFSWTILVTFAALLLSAGSNAYASCGQLSGLAMPGPVTLPMLAGSAPRLDGNAIPSLGPNTSIVGLWHVIYTAGGHQFNESLDQWHSDGTEFENATLPPAVGNICFGVWKQVALRTVRLHHVGWMFNTDGSLAGSFTLDETNTVAGDGATYSGNFTFRIYDVSGTFTGVEVQGTLAASRITVS